MRHGWDIRLATILLAACAGAAGCGPRTPGETRILGPVPYEAAFASGQEVMSQYFSVAEADAERGRIVSRPKHIEADNDRILGGSPARQIATLRLRRDGGDVVAQATVQTQRQGQSVHRQRAVQDENYDGAPNKSPSYYEAATTPEQNETWVTRSYDHALERKMLDDLFRRLHHQAAP